MKLYFLHIALVLLFASECIVAHKQNPVSVPKDAVPKRIEYSTTPLSYTPKGVSVDTHGRALDTDGDGIPDYKDKELLTPQSCFPVDSTGNSVCPDPSCCKEFDRGMVDPFYCSINMEIHFTPKSKALTKAAIELLKMLAKELKSSPTCKLKVGTYGGETKSSQRISWDRVNLVIRYLVEKEKIAEDRFLFAYDLGDLDIVELEGTSADGPNSIPAPHPRKKN